MSRKHNIWRGAHGKGGNAHSFKMVPLSSEEECWDNDDKGLEFGVFNCNNKDGNDTGDNNCHM